MQLKTVVLQWSGIGTGPLLEVHFPLSGLGFKSLKTADGTCGLLVVGGGTTTALQHYPRTTAGFDFILWWFCQSLNN